MRLLHTSDWHLGRIFHGIHLTEDQAYILDQFIALAADVKPDAIVVAGDIYDRAVPPTEAVQLLDEILFRLTIDLGIPTILIAGNHDSPERLGFGSRFMERQGLYVIGQVGQEIAPIYLEDKYGPVCFVPLTYAEPALVRDRFAITEPLDHHTAMQVVVEHMMQKARTDVRKVAIAHAFIAGGEQSESERPLSVGGSGNVGPALFRPFHYTALGHLHNAQAAGAEHIRYAGSLMKYSFDEAHHKKGVYLVDLDGEGNVKTEQISLTPRREVRRISGSLQDVLHGGQQDGARQDYVMVTLQDTDAILDVMGKLRQVYPQVLHVERPHLMSGGNLSKPNGDHRRQSELQLFESFFAQATGQPLSEGQHGEMVAVLEALQRQRRETGV